MGTRGAVGVKIGKEFKITYNHFDSYPSSLGKEVVNFCKNIQKDTESVKGKSRKERSNTGWELFKRRARQLKLVVSDSKPSKYFQNKYSKFFDGNVSSQSITEWYCLLRDAQHIAALTTIYDGSVKRMIDGSDFLKDSLFCEYAYIINLDDMTLEFYEGFNNEPQEDNPLPFKQEPFRDASERVSDCPAYYPVSYKGSMSLSNIDNDWEETFFPSDEEAKV